MNYCWLETCVFFGLLIILVTGGISVTTTSVSTDNDNVLIYNSEAVQGSVARLPCNVTPPIIEDKISLVIWYKDGHTSPIYSFDARSFKLERGIHWADENTLNGRGFFQPNTYPAIFSIETTKSIDSGVYRCRVDFQKSPTRYSKVNLTVIIPPETVLILDEKGDHIPHYILGPYNEGGSVDLTCVSTGGNPLPRLTWWQENFLLDDSFTISGEKRVKNVLHLEKLQRHHLNSVLTCQASNNNVTIPISSDVTLDMNLRPLWVKLQGENRPLSAEHTYELWCEVVGARPTPTITWWKGSVQMKNTKETTSPDGNTTISVLTFIPKINDGGKFLSCRGEQLLIADSGMESGWKLDIHHVPVVTLELGTNINTTVIREGADVYFECNIKSNPWVYKVNWKHNGKYLYNNVLAGIIVANQSLVLQNVSRVRSGNYTCIGSNEEGDGESNLVVLDVKFAPICRPGQIFTYGLAREENSKIICELEANPSDVNFTWKFNTSTYEYIDPPLDKIAVDKTKSIFYFTPHKEQDYGTLFCWGSNDIGVQQDPCIYIINPAGRPDPLTNCTVLNQTNDILQLQCIEGFDGGLPQEFIVEVYSARTNQLIASQTSKEPIFELKGLEPEFGYNINVVAVNKKGKSAITIHPIYSLNNAEKHTDFLLPYTGSMLHMKLFLGAMAGLVFGIILITVVAFLIIRVRSKNKEQRRNDVSSHETTNHHTAVSTPTSGQQLLQTTQQQQIMLQNQQQQQQHQQQQQQQQHQHQHQYQMYHQQQLHNLHPYSQQQPTNMFREIQLSTSTESLEKNPDIIPQGKEDIIYDDVGNRIVNGMDINDKQYHWHPNITASSMPQTFISVTLAEHQLQHYTSRNTNNNYQSRNQQENYNMKHIPNIEYTVTQPNTLSNCVGGGGVGGRIISNNYDNQYQQNNEELNYAELSLVIPKQQAIYTSATLGRPTHKDIRLNEPTIYAQIDLAHNPLTGSDYNGEVGGIINNGKKSGYNIAETPFTWIPTSQAIQANLRQLQQQQQQHDIRIPPIVCARETINLRQNLSTKI